MRDAAIIFVFGMLVGLILGWPFGVMNERLSNWLRESRDRDRR